MEVYLIRHGETSDNIRKVFSGSVDVALTDNGRKQARQLAKRLVGIDFDLAISSDLSRARDTLVSALGVDEVSTTPLLRERSFGQFEGQPYSVFREGLKLSGLSMEDYSPPDGERFEQIQERLDSFWNQYLEGFSGRVILSAHGSINRMILKWLLGLTFEEQLELKQGNTCVNILRGSAPGAFEAEVIDCTKHLN